MLFLDAEYASTGAHRLLGSDYAASSLSLHATLLDGHAYPTQVISCTAHRSSPCILSYIAPNARIRWPSTCSPVRVPRKQSIASQL